VNNQQGHILMLTADRQIDRRILLEADSLEADGWKVTILAMPLDKPSLDNDSRVTRLGGQEVSHIQKREHILIRVYHYVRKVVPMHGTMMRSIKRFVWTYLTNPEQFYMHLFVDEALKQPADIIVAHDLSMLAPAHKVAKENQAMLVYDSHELYAEQEFSHREKMLWCAVEDKYIRDCDLVITVNQSIAEELEHRYHIETPLVIRNCEMLPEPLPSNEKLFHRVFLLDGDALVILYQGGISPNRNLHTLIKMMEHVDDSNVHLVFLGDGQYKASLKKLVNKLRLQKNIHFHAAVSQRELLQYTVSADIGIIPYQANCLNNKYCTPNKLFEFVIAGLPVIATDLPELNRILYKYKIGVTTDTSSPEPLSAVICEFFSDDEKRQQCIHAVKVTRLQLNWQQEQQGLIDAYRELLTSDSK